MVGGFPAAPHRLRGVPAAGVAGHGRLDRVVRRRRRQRGRTRPGLAPGRTGRLPGVGHRPARIAHRPRGGPDRRRRRHPRQPGGQVAVRGVRADGRQPVPAGVAAGVDHPGDGLVVAGGDGPDRCVDARDSRAAVEVRPCFQPRGRSVAEDPGAARGTRGSATRGQRTAGQAHAGEDRTACAAAGREERPRQARAADPAVPRRRRLGHPAAGAARRAQAAGERLRRADAGDAVPADRVQAQGLPHRRTGGRRLPGPGDHPLRDRTGAGDQGQPDLLAGQGHRPRPVGEVGARGGRDPRQVGGRPGNPELAPRDDLPERAASLARIRQVRERADAGAGQGHRRPADRGRPGPHAAPAGRRHHRLGEVRRHQRDDPVARLQVARLRRAAHPGRPEDARVVGLRGHPAPPRAGGDRHAPGRRGAALVRGGDGPALQAHVRGGRAQPGRLQQESARCDRRRPAACWTRCTSPMPS